MPTTLIGFTNFETGDTSESTAITSRASISTSFPHSGIYSLNVNPLGAGLGSYKLGDYAVGLGGPALTTLFFAGSTDIYIRFYVYTATMPTMEEEIFSVLAGGTSSSADLSLRLSGSGSLALYANGVSVASTAVGAIAASGTYKISLKFQLNAAAAPFQVMINATVAMSGNQRFGTGAMTGAFLGKNTNINSSGYQLYYDDVAWSSGGYPADSMGALWLPTSGSGSFSGFSGTYADVDEVPEDGDTSFIAASPVASTITQSFPTVQSVPGSLGAATINAVKPVCYARLASGAVSVASGVAFPTTFYGSGTALLSGSYAPFGIVQITNPATSAAWTLSDVNSAEAAIQVTGTGTARCTAMYVLVDYTLIASTNPLPKQLIVGVPWEYYRERD